MGKVKWKQRRLKGSGAQQIMETALTLDRQRNAANIQLISDICDLTVPSSALGYVNLDDGIVGLAGTVSSLLGVYSVWQKTA